MYKFLLSLSIAVTIVIFANAQNCDCESNFAWTKQTFEQNDVGFQYVINKKGVAEYENHNAKIAEKIKSAQNNSQCAEVINEWLLFFRKNHIGIDVLKNDAPPTNNVVNQQDSVKLFPQWETVDIDIVEFKKYLDSKKDVDTEGIWYDLTYKIGVKHIDNQYVGFIIESQAKSWEAGQIKFRIFPDSAVFYANDHSAKVIDRAYLFSKNMLLFDEEFAFARNYPQYEDKFLISTFFNSQPYFEMLNDKTCYLRIPSFALELRQTIDNVINDNRQAITTTENLIIDLRFNGGGSDLCWESIAPLVYTNPYRVKHLTYLSTEMNNEHYKKYDNNLFELLNKNLGKFVKQWNGDYSEIKFDTIYEYPKQLAIIVDMRCGSATEDFLLMAKQSKKVKIFGKVTAGAFDFSNLSMVNSPCNDFCLSYATSRSADIENFPIDGIGIQPDFYLDNSIQEYQWVDYVTKILNNDFE
jgi:hypothetical protein